MIFQLIFSNPVIRQIKQSFKRKKSRGNFRKLQKRHYIIIKISILKIKRINATNPEKRICQRLMKWKTVSSINTSINQTKPPITLI